MNFSIDTKISRSWLLRLKKPAMNQTQASRKHKTILHRTVISSWFKYLSIIILIIKSVFLTKEVFEGGSPRVAAWVRCEYIWRTKLKWYYPIIEKKHDGLIEKLFNGAHKERAFRTGREVRRKSARIIIHNFCKLYLVWCTWFRYINYCAEDSARFTLLTYVRWTGLAQFGIFTLLWVFSTTSFLRGQYNTYNTQNH